MNINTSLCSDTALEWSNELPAESQHLPAQAIYDKSQWLKFNVGGTMLETTRTSLERLKSEFFSLLLDQDVADSVPPTNDIYRIDRDANVLQVLLNYGRYQKIVAVPEHITQAFLQSEIKFYKMHKDVEKAIEEFFEERRLGPNSVRIENVTITEMAMDKGRMHHNVYDVMRTSAIFCYTKVPGNGTCYHDVSHLFAYEMPHSKFPALFRATCLQCERKICVADDPIIGLEGWCHKCRLCLRCQDILCSVVPDKSEENKRQGNLTAVSVENETLQEVRKTASVVFVCETKPQKMLQSPNMKTTEGFINEGIDNETGVAIAKATGLKLPKIRQGQLSPVRAGDALQLSTRRHSSFTGAGAVTNMPKSFQEFLNKGSWSFS